MAQHQGIQRARSLTTFVYAPSFVVRLVLLVTWRYLVGDRNSKCMKGRRASMRNEELVLQSTTLTQKKLFLFQYGISVMVLGLALLLTHLLWPLIEPSASMLFFAAIMIAAFYGGLGPGLLVSVLSALAIDYYFVAPFSGFELSVANIVRVGVFLLVAIMTSWLNASRKQLLEDIKERNRERDKLVTQISGFNAELRKEIAAAPIERNQYPSSRRDDIP